MGGGYTDIHQIFGLSKIMISTEFYVFFSPRKPRTLGDHWWPLVSRCTSERSKRRWKRPWTWRANFFSRTMSMSVLFLERVLPFFSVDSGDCFWLLLWKVVHLKMFLYRICLWRMVSFHSCVKSALKLPQESKNRYTVHLPQLPFPELRSETPISCYLVPRYIQLPTIKHGKLENPGYKWRFSFLGKIIDLFSQDVSPCYRIGKSFKTFFLDMFHHVSHFFICVCLIFMSPLHCYIPLSHRCHRTRWMTTPWDPWVVSGRRLTGCGLGWIGCGHWVLGPRKFCPTATWSKLWAPNATRSRSGLIYGSG